MSRLNNRAGVALGVLPLLGLLTAACWAAAPEGKPTGFWIDPDTPGARKARVLAERGREPEATLLRRIADQPVAVWLTEENPAPRVARIAEQAAGDNRVPIFVAYNIPQRDCGHYSAGGAGSDSAYRDWVARLAKGLGSRKAVVVLEPDAVPHTVAGCRDRARDDRLALLNEAVRTLKARPGASVYVDAGNASWIKDTDALARYLTAAGVKRADGFALNVANFQTTAASEEYGDKVSRALGGVHYVIDTSRNGNGPPPDTQAPATGAEAWCNPPDRALGVPPTTRTGHPLVDAYLWIKRPGESDGTCRGGPPAGQWWTDYALSLARAAGEGMQTPEPPQPPAAPEKPAQEQAQEPPQKPAPEPAAEEAGAASPAATSPPPAPTASPLTSHAPTSPATESPASP
ncbi:glycoside hydrolase family 6 protein [Streptomyces ochraceiscleroticus]|uniref:Glucanase n=1 Tax=Streptomyces ochraceiscleroticus TaxID=47761 RepID=A0ABW1MHD3_9ACTN|nr:glycoside hydrolase family 6 protein [Streptomyces ochraceiscleroticus]